MGSPQIRDTNNVINVVTQFRTSIRIQNIDDTAVL